MLPEMLNMFSHCSPYRYQVIKKHCRYHRAVNKSCKWGHAGSPTNYTERLWICHCNQWQR